MFLRRPGISGHPIAVYQSAYRITQVIVSVRIELSSSIAVPEADICLIEGTDDLKIRGGAKDLGPGDRALRHNASSVTRLGAVGDDVGLNVADGTIRGG